MQNSYRNDDSLKNKEFIILCLAFLNLTTRVRCAKQIFNLKNEQWRVFLCKFRHLEIICRHVKFGRDLKFIVWESRDKMNLPNIHGNCL